MFMMLPKENQKFSAMKIALLIMLATQCGLTGAAVVFNATLLAVIIKSKANLGNYKYLMLSFCVFEALFAIICFIGMPVWRPLQNFDDKSDAFNSWSYMDRIYILWNVGKYQICQAGADSLLYDVRNMAWFYHASLHISLRSFVSVSSQVLLKTYNSPRWAQSISATSSLKVCIIVAIIYYISLCMLCSLYLCPYDVASTVCI